MTRKLKITRLLCRYQHTLSLSCGKIVSLFILEMINSSHYQTMEMLLQSITQSCLHLSSKRNLDWSMSKYGNCIYFYMTHLTMDCVCADLCRAWWAIVGMGERAGTLLAANGYTLRCLAIVDNVCV